MFDLLTGKDNFMLYISLRIHPRHDHENVMVKFEREVESLVSW